MSQNKRQVRVRRPAEVASELPPITEADKRDIFRRSYKFNVEKLGLPKAKARKWAEGTVRAMTACVE